jgi:hypothetical protein
VEKMKVLFLAAILAVLVVIAFRPRREIGRFVEVDAGSNLALDTATGQWCVWLRENLQTTVPLNFAAIFAEAERPFWTGLLQRRNLGMALRSSMQEIVRQRAPVQRHLRL